MKYIHIRYLYCISEYWKASVFASKHMLRNACIDSKYRVFPTISCCGH